MVKETSTTSLNHLGEFNPVSFSVAEKVVGNVFRTRIFPLPKMGMNETVTHFQENLTFFKRGENCTGDVPIRNCQQE